MFVATIAIAIVIGLGLLSLVYRHDDTLKGLFLCTPPHPMSPEACEALVSHFLDDSKDAVAEDHDVVSH
jgi:hypothetical protein